MPWIHFLILARGLLGTLVILAILLAIAYGCLCTQVAAVTTVGPEHSIILVGRVRSAHGEGVGAAVYELEDPTGRIFVTTQVGAPAEGALVLVRGKKIETDEGRPIVVEHQRTGSF